MPSRAAGLLMSFRNHSSWASVAAGPYADIPSRYAALGNQYGYCPDTRGAELLMSFRKLSSQAGVAAGPYTEFFSNLLLFL